MPTLKANPRCLAASLSKFTAGSGLTVHTAPEMKSREATLQKSKGGSPCGRRPGDLGQVASSP